MRTIEQIQQDYAQKCLALGDLVYKQRTLHAQAEDIIRNIEALDHEALALRKASAAAENAQESTAPAEKAQE